MMSFILWPLAIVLAVIAFCASVAWLFWRVDQRFANVIKEIDPKDLP